MRSAYQDVSTVVSILPYRLSINLPTVYPGTYVIEAVPEGKFDFIHVQRGRTDRYLGGPTNNGIVSLPVLSEEIADAIAKDHIRANVSVVRGEAEPGIFALPGAATPDLIAKSEELKGARSRQREWFIRIVNQADVDWKRTGNTRAVGMLALEAAKRLGLNKEWTTAENVKYDEMNKCPVCMAVVNPNAVICMTCKYVINKVEFEKIKNQFASEMK